MGRSKLNHVQYKRNIHPDFIDKMDKALNKLKKEQQGKTEEGPIYKLVKADQKGNIYLEKLTTAKN
jgi:hypothetical protein